MPFWKLFLQFKFFIKAIVKASLIYNFCKTICAKIYLASQIGPLNYICKKQTQYL